VRRPRTWVRTVASDDLLKRVRDNGETAWVSSPAGRLRLTPLPNGCWSVAELDNDGNNHPAETWADVRRWVRYGQPHRWPTD
jgi:hypothetical protein